MDVTFDERVWVVLVHENQTTHVRVSKSLDSIASFLWKRKWIWIDEWHLDDGPELSIPEDLASSLESFHADAMQKFVSSPDWSGEAHVGPLGPVVDGKETGFQVFVHLLRLRMFP